MYWSGKVCNGWEAYLDLSEIAFDLAKAVEYVAGKNHRTGGLSKALGPND